MIFDANLLQSREETYTFTSFTGHRLYLGQTIRIYVLYIGSVNVARKQESLYLCDEFHLESFEMAEAPRIV